MKKTLKALSAAVIAGAMTLTLSVSSASASRVCGHYKITKGRSGTTYYRSATHTITVDGHTEICSYNSVGFSLIYGCRECQRRVVEPAGTERDELHFNPNCPSYHNGGSLTIKENESYTLLKPRV